MFFIFYYTNILFSVTANAVQMRRKKALCDNIPYKDDIFQQVIKIRGPF